MSALPAFSGKVFLRDDSEAYKVHAYQYAYTSEPEGTMAPAAIIYVANDEDIQLAIQYARENNLGIAVRTGGHEYIGASSTTGDNIQIDLSGREASDRSGYPYRQSSVDKHEGSMTVGAALNVDDVNKICCDNSVFFPHGECCEVHIGGHTQTGGVSVISRTFGVMIDHLLRFDIILADGSKRTVERDSQDPLDQDLWFAVLGGSPGNLGVLTSITIKYLKDEDYPKSRGFKMAWLFSRHTLEHILDIINEMNDDPDGDPDFCLSAMALGEEFDNKIPSFLPETFDNYVMKHYPHLTGKNKFHWVVPVIVVIGAWTNSKGPDQDDSHVDAVFKRFRDVEGMLPADLLNTLWPIDKMMNGKERRPLSYLLKALTLENAREFNLSAKKLLWFGKNTKTMSKKNGTGHTFAHWVSEKVKELESIRGAFEYRGMKAAVQAGMLGGPGMNNPPIKTAMGNRDGNYWFAFDVFYDPKIKHSREKTTQFTNDIAQDIVSGKLDFWDDHKQRRLILGPMLINDEQPILDEQWEHYYDDRAVYDRLLRIKEAVDPDHIFTPNLFCVGATRCARFSESLDANPESE